MVLLCLNPNYKINCSLISIFGEQNTRTKLLTEIFSFEIKGGEKVGTTGNSYIRQIIRCNSWINRSARLFVNSFRYFTGYLKILFFPFVFCYIQ